MNAVNIILLPPHDAAVAAAAVIFAAQLFIFLLTRTAQNVVIPNFVASNLAMVVAELDFMALLSIECWTLAIRANFPY